MPLVTATEMLALFRLLFRPHVVRLTQFEARIVVRLALAIVVEFPDVWTLPDHIHLPPDALLLESLQNILVKQL